MYGIRELRGRRGALSGAEMFAPAASIGCSKLQPRHSCYAVPVVCCCISNFRQTNTKEDQFISIRKSCDEKLSELPGRPLFGHKAKKRSERNTNKRDSISGYQANAHFKGEFFSSRGFWFFFPEKKNISSSGYET
jgi:hypothetical protein